MLLDLGFHYGELHESQLESITLAHIRLCVVVPTELATLDEVADWSHLADLPWIWVDKHCPLYVMLLDRLKEQWPLPKKSVTTADEQVVWELVASGQGVAVMRVSKKKLFTLLIVTNFVTILTHLILLFSFIANQVVSGGYFCLVVRLACFVCQFRDHLPAVKKPQKHPVFFLLILST